MITVPEDGWARDADQLMKELQSSVEEGLTDQEAEARLRHFGPNRKREPERVSAAAILLNQFKSLIILLLFIAAVISYFLGDIPETIAIVVVIMLNAQIGFWTEWRGRRSMEALLRMGEVPTRVVRNGQTIWLDAEELVPGDMVVLEGGDMVPADCRLVRSSRLQTNESSLTGESLPVDKDIEVCEVEVGLSDRFNMVFQGTFVVRGSAQALVLMTGLKTELGKISELVRTAQEERTPLEERLEALGGRLILITLVIAFVIFLIGYVRDYDVLEMLETAIALAVAAIPEGLPVVATISLANGMRMMVRQNAVMTRLSSVETLGSTTMICTDKTGTLTENEMRVRGVVMDLRDEPMWISGTFWKKRSLEDSDSATLPEPESDSKLEYEPESEPELFNTYPLNVIRRVSILCNNATVDKKIKTGDPLEIALLESFISIKYDKLESLSHTDRLREEAFDSATKMMAVWVHSEEYGNEVYVKGAPGVVLSHCVNMASESEGAIHKEDSKAMVRPLTEEERDKWGQLIATYASQGFRLLGLARKASKGDPATEHPYEALTFLGFLLLSDPPRIDVREAIESCKEAGIRVIMLTGDQPETAVYVAREVGLLYPEESGRAIHGDHLPELEEIEAIPSKMEEIYEANIFARITPRQKLDLIQFYQNRGEVVAMTGDGVNDAPALKKADIGVAMGQRGTQVAMDASDMILRDDALGTIVKAIRQGRVIFQNIRRFILFLLSCNVSEIFLVAMTTTYGVLITPLQILFLNLVTDVFPALALGMNKGENGVMEQSPRDPKEPLITRHHWGEIIGYGAVIASLSILGAWISVNYLGAKESQLITIIFYILALSQLAHVLNMRSPKSDLFRNEVIRNKWVWLAVGICLLLLGGVYWIPILQSVLSIKTLSPEIWMVIILCSGSVIGIGHAWLRWSKKGWD